MGEWWVQNNGKGQNMLAGVEDDLTNPIRLSDVVIVDFLRRIPAARSSFETLVPTMLPLEQDRLRGLVLSANLVQPDLKKTHDDFQAAHNKAGVRTTGVRGGTRIGGNN